jgi:tRNA nucleotidyltransferase/poly(A) polymerase
METRVKFEMVLPSDIINIQSIFKKNGHDLFVVGGAVRDALLGKNPKDFDLATDAVPDKVEEIMRQGGLRTIATGKAFGVINVFTDSDEYEIATFRIDNSSGRRPDGVTFTNIEGDVKRRDLTINALFFDIDKSEIVDLVGGIDDIKNGVIRTVGSPEDRFGEDRLRILRAIRFAGRFGSDLNAETDAALHNDASLEGVSGERIRDEFVKGIKSAKSVVHFLGLIDRYNLFEWVFKGLDVKKSFVENSDPLIVIARLIKGNNSDILGKSLNGLKYSTDEIVGIKFLLTLITLNVDNVVVIKKTQSNAGITDDQILVFSEIEDLSSVLINAFIIFNLSVKGPETMAKFNLKQGPELGKVMHSLERENFKKLL